MLTISPSSTLLGAVSTVLHIYHDFHTLGSLNGRINIASYHWKPKSHAKCFIHAGGGKL